MCAIDNGEMIRIRRTSLVISKTRDKTHPFPLQINGKKVRVINPNL